MTAISADVVLKALVSMVYPLCQATGDYRSWIEGSYCAWSAERETAQQKDNRLIDLS